MIIKVYVNDDYEVISENQYQKLIDKKTTDLNKVDLSNLFDEWLDSFYDKVYETYNLLTADDKKRNDALSKFMAWVRVVATEELEKEWYEREVEI